MRDKCFCDFVDNFLKKYVLTVCSTQIFEEFCEKMNVCLFTYTLKGGIKLVHRDKRRKIFLASGEEFPIIRSRHRPYAHYS